MTQPTDLNPYATPAAKVSDRAAGEAPVFFAVSLPKLAIMSLFTLSFYLVYWFYKQWQAVYAPQTRTARAVLAALFYPLCSYWLFLQINERSSKLGAPAALPAGGLAIAVILLSVTQSLPDLASLLALLSFLPLLQVQRALNGLNAKFAPGSDPNARFGAWNVAGIAVGALMYALIVVGYMLPESTP